MTNPMPSAPLPSAPTPDSGSGSDVIAETRGHVAVLTLNRPAALNALSLQMIRDLTRALLAWENDENVSAVVLRGNGRPGKAPAFCAGGDIRWFHQAALEGDPRLEDFFTEEYALNHLIHRFPKPVLALMDGVTMGGGMGISQGAALRVVTEHSKLAMPETHIGLFPDVGGGWFLARLAGHLGEYLALTGHVLKAADAIAVGWADVHVPAERLDALVDAVVTATPAGVDGGTRALETARAFATDAGAVKLPAHRALIDRVFALDTVGGIVEALRATPDPFAEAAIEVLATHSPLMLHVTLAQVRRARTMTLAEDLRMERDLVRHCFNLRPGASSETVEGIRALVIDKDHAPAWSPSRVEDVDAADIAAFFASPWPAWAHPLRHLE
jgi:enoyl-CoA hydratase